VLVAEKEVLKATEEVLSKIECVVAALTGTNL
jgi:hypothetical protein